MIGIVSFTVASALCGLADSPAQLLAARALQGLGGALLFPQVISSILTIFPARQRGRAFGLFGAIVGFAPVIGPVVGGFLLAHLSWRWIFFINVPIGIATAVLALTFAPPMRSGRTHRLDLVGVALVTAGLSGIVFGLIEGSAMTGAPSPGRSASPRSSSRASCCWWCSSSGSSGSGKSL
ncbi:MFS transporter [Streptomyces sp. FXJ1.4098]|nr:MFS transporter [Streptomyces sp. FXJ1.4098]